MLKFIIKMTIVVILHIIAAIYVVPYGAPVANFIVMASFVIFAGSVFIKNLHHLL